MIGVAGPFSGSRAAYGRLLRRAAERAAGRHGAADRLVFLDDAADPAVARGAAARFVAMGVAGVVGHFSSQCAQAVADIYHRARIPLLLPASTSVEIPREGEGYVVRLCGDNRGQAEAVLGWLGSKGIAGARVFRDRSRYAAELEAALRQAAGSGFALESWEPHGGPVQRGAVLLLGTHPSCVEALRALAGKGRPGPVVACDDCSIDEYLEAASASGLDAHHAQPDPGFAELAAAAVEHLLRPSAPIPKGGWRIADSKALHAQPVNGV